MSDRIHDHDPTELHPEEARQGLRGADVLGMLAISTFLAAVGLGTFFLTTAAG